MSGSYPTVIQTPSNVSSITLGDGVHTPVNNLITDASDSDATLVTAATAYPRVVSVNVTTGQTNITLPSNVSSITVSGTVYTPDGSQWNIISLLSDSDATTICQQGFKLVASAASS